MRSKDEENWEEFIGDEEIILQLELSYDQLQDRSLFWYQEGKGDSIWGSLELKMVGLKVMEVDEESEGSWDR